MEKYDKVTDEQLIKDFRNGDREIMDHLMMKYKAMVRKKARAMYLFGGENEDLIQEGMIGLFKAVRDYDSGQEGEERRTPLIDTIEPVRDNDPEVLYLGKKFTEVFIEQLKDTLSPLENHVMYLHLMGTDYKTIAELLGKSPKSIDNALQRIKAKAEKMLDKSE